MIGVGPGALPTDAAMIGIDPLDQRAALEEDFEVLMRVLLNDEPISIETKISTPVKEVCVIGCYRRRPGVCDTGA